MPESLESILASIRNKKEKGIPSIVNVAPKPMQFISSSDNKIKDMSYDVPIDSIYDRNRDGSYSPKFENYKGATGNEDRLAKEQGFFEQAGKGIGKALIKTGTYALDATVGTAVGLINGISEGSWDAIWDNEFSNTLDDFNKSLDRNLANYYTDEEKSNGLLAAIPGFGATNFWFNDVAGGLAFVAGAILPEIAIGALSGGATIGVGAAKIGARAGGKALFKEGAEETIGAGARAIGNIKKASGYNAYKEGSKVLKDQYRKVFRNKTAGDVFGTAAFLTRSSGFEAGMEARHNYHTAISDYFSDFEELNGKQPSYEEATQFMKDAKSAANSVYGANLAILSVSNAVMFSNKFNIGVETGKKTTNFFNKSIGLGYESVGGKAVMKEATKSQKVLGNIYLGLGKPSVEGLYEEGFQGVAGTAMQNYLKAKYDPETEIGYSGWASIQDAFAHQYGSSEGWKEMGIGMIIGSMGGVMQKGQPNIAGFGKGSRKSREAEIRGQVDLMNKGTDNLAKDLIQASVLGSFNSKSKDKDGGTNLDIIDKALMAKEFIRSQEKLKSRSDIIEDFNLVVDKLEMDENHFESEEEFNLHKESLKSEFEGNYSDYRYASRVVSSLGLDRGVKDSKGNILKDSKGNTLEVADALINNIMVGKSGLNKAKDIASQIESVTGLSGVFSVLEHYGSLSQEKRKIAKEIKGKQGRLAKLKEEYINFQNKIEGLPSKGRGRFSEETKQKRYKDASEKANATQRQIINLETEIKTLGEALDSDLRAENFSIDSLSDTEGTTQDILKSIEEIDKLDKFIISLDKSGRTNDAVRLEYLVNEYKKYSDAHREMNNTYRKMVDTDFFNSKEGKGLRSMILGDKYKMSDEFKAIIKKHDAEIDKSLRLTLHRGQETVEEEIRKSLEDNEELSDREKFRMEAIIRLTLGYKNAASVIEEASELASESIIKSGKAMSEEDRLRGDTVQLINRLNVEGKNLGNVAVLNDLINKITNALDSFRFGTLNTAKIAELEESLKSLKEERSKIDEEAINNKIKDLREDIKAAKALESEEEVARLEAEIETEKSKFPKELDKDIKALEKELEETKARKEFKIVKSPEYRRLYELNTKKANEELTPEELDELVELEQDIDEWMMITGTVVEGLRLSDLIQQKAILENTEIATVEQVVTVTNQEIIDSSDIGDASGNANYDLTQTYDGVTAITDKDGNVEVSGITWEFFASEAGIPLKSITTKKVKGKDQPTGPFTTNDRGNLILPKELVDTINETGRISIVATNKSLVTSYSMVLRTTDTVDGGTETKVLKSNYKFGPPTKTKKEDEKVDRSTMQPNAIYEMNVDDNVVFEIDPRDPFNKDLIDRYNKAKGDKAKEAIREEMRTGIVIRVRRASGGGEFVSVLKSKRAGGMRNKDISDKFESMRNQVVNDDSIFSVFLDIKSPRVIEKFNGAKVEYVYIGHPNFNYNKDEEGNVVIETKELTAMDISKIQDTGYYDKDGMHTMSGKNENIRKGLLDKAIRGLKPGAKIPFVIVQKGSQRIAIPVTVAPNEKEDLQEFEDIFKSKMEAVDKASALNVFMAKRGVDIQLDNNSFIVSGTTNMNDKFFSEKLAQLERINYFRDLKAWANSKNSKEDILSQGVSSSINISDPIHSPKIKIDYSGVDIEVTASVNTNPTSTKPIKKGTSNRGTRLLQGVLSKARKKDC